MIYLAIIIALTFVTFTLGVSGINKYVSPGIKQMKKDVLKLREENKKRASGLIPLSSEELELLSDYPVVSSFRKKIRKEKKGFLHSIYNEPLVSFTIKNYFWGKKRKIIYVRTSEEEYVFINKRNLVQFYLNGHPIGKVDGDHLFHPDSGKILAKVEGSPRQNREVKIGDKRLALLNPESEVKDISSRALQYISNMNDSERKILSAIVIYKVLENE